MSLRLYILPISTRRSLLYCQTLKSSSSGSNASSSPTASPHTQTWTSSPRGKITHYLDLATQKVTSKWLLWETAEWGWQRWLTRTGNRVLYNLPYEEWGLKSVMAARAISSGTKPPPAATAGRGGSSTSTTSSSSRDESRSGHEETGKRSRDATTRTGVAGGIPAVAEKGKEMTKRRVKVEYPGSVWDEEKVMEAVRGYAGEERQRFHRRWMWWSFAGMPVTIPFGVIPV